MSGPELVSVQWGADLDAGTDMMRVIAKWLSEEDVNWLVEINQFHTAERLDGLVIGYVELTADKEEFEGLLILPTVDSEPVGDAQPVFVPLITIRTLVIP